MLLLSNCQKVWKLCLLEFCYIWGLSIPSKSQALIYPPRPWIRLFDQTPFSWSNFSSCGLGFLSSGWGPFLWHEKPLSAELVSLLAKLNKTQESTLAENSVYNFSWNSGPKSIFLPALFFWNSGLKFKLLMALSGRLMKMKFPLFLGHVRHESF